MLNVQKSPEAFRTISEVASDLDVPQHVLRFWETKFGAVKPLKRGGGRRYYRPDDVDLLRGIRALLYTDGLTIKGVQRILRVQGVRYVVEIGRGDASLMDTARDGRALRQAETVEAPALEKTSNVHPFPRMALSAEEPSVDETAYEDGLDVKGLNALLAELLGMKERLQDARL